MGNRLIVWRGKRPKYRNQKVEYDGIKFDSLKECNRYQELKMLEKAGEIRSLEVHPWYEIEVSGKKICKYIADFRYWIRNNGVVRVVVEDVKSKPTMTPTYRLKKKLMKAVYGIEVKEV